MKTSFKSLQKELTCTMGSQEKELTVSKTGDMVGHCTVGSYDYRNTLAAITALGSRTFKSLAKYKSSYLVGLLTFKSLAFLQEQLSFRCGGFYIFL